MQRATFILVKVKPCNALVHMLLACRSFLKSVLRYNFFNFCYCHPDTVYLRE